MDSDEESEFEEGEWEARNLVMEGGRQGLGFTDPWARFKEENELKVRQLMGDKELVTRLRTKLMEMPSPDPVSANRSMVLGTSHKDLTTTTIPVNSLQMDMLASLSYVEMSLVELVLSFCDTASLYSARLVNRQWSQLVEVTCLATKTSKIRDRWEKCRPSTKVYSCPAPVSCVTGDDFGLVVGMENGKISVLSRLRTECDLLWVGHWGLVTALHVTNSVVLSCGREMGEGGKVEVWDRETARHRQSLKPPRKETTRDSFTFLLLKHNRLLAAGLDTDLWIWGVKEQEEGPEFSLQYRLTGHYSPVLSCDLDLNGHLMTGTKEAQVRLWSLEDRMRGVAVHNQHGNPVTRVQLRWPLGMSASSGSVRLYHHPSGACLRTFRFSSFVFDLHLTASHFVTSHQDGCLNFWSLECLIGNLGRNCLHRGKLRVRPRLADQEVWGNKGAARQGRFLVERTCLVTWLGETVTEHDYWLGRGERDLTEDGEGWTGRDCGTPTSLPSLVSDVSEDEDWGQIDNLLLQEGA